MKVWKATTENWSLAFSSRILTKQTCLHLLLLQLLLLQITFSSVPKFHFLFDQKVKKKCRWLPVPVVSFLSEPPPLWNHPPPASAVVLLLSFFNLMSLWVEAMVAVWVGFVGFESGSGQGGDGDRGRFVSCISRRIRFMVALVMQLRPPLLKFRFLVTRSAAFFRIVPVICHMVLLWMLWGFLDKLWDAFMGSEKKALGWSNEANLWLLFVEIVAHEICVMCIWKECKKWGPKKK